MRTELVHEVASQRLLCEGVMGSSLYRACEAAEEVLHPANEQDTGPDAGWSHSREGSPSAGQLVRSNANCSSQQLWLFIFVLPGRTVSMRISHLASSVASVLAYTMPALKLLHIYQSKDSLHVTMLSNRGRCFCIIFHSEALVANDVPFMQHLGIAIFVCSSTI